MNKPHLIILAEDDANRQLAHAFLREIRERTPDPRQIESLSKRSGKSSDGWRKTIDEKFLKDQVPIMLKYPDQIVLLLIDFDEKTDHLNHRTYTSQRLSELKLSKLELEGLKKRVFVLGVWSEPEQLKKNLGQSFEEIGKSLAKACINDDNTPWQHDLLKHNLQEIERMKSSVKPLLFKQSAQS